MATDLEQLSGFLFYIENGIFSILIKIALMR